MRTFNTTDPDDAAALTYLDQIPDIDGAGIVDVEEAVTNGSGRVIGARLTVSDQVASFIDGCVRRYAADREGAA